MIYILYNIYMCITDEPPNCMQYLIFLLVIIFALSTLSFLVGADQNSHITVAVPIPKSDLNRHENFQEISWFQESLYSILLIFRMFWDIFVHFYTFSGNIRKIYSHACLKTKQVCVSGRVGEIMTSFNIYPGFITWVSIKGDGGPVEAQ